MKLTVNRDRVLRELRELSRFSSHTPPAEAGSPKGDPGASPLQRAGDYPLTAPVTRIVFTPEDLAARKYLRSRYEAAGLTVRVDPIGNTFARWTGTDPNLPGVGTGSHTDAIPNAGMYDGTVGVLGGLEAIRALQDAGFKPRRSIEVLMFTSEEPTRFGLGCSGSRTLAGMPPEVLKKLTDDAGDDYDTVRTRAGFSGSLSDIELSQDYYHAFVELHIEQGPRLEAANLPIGIVTAIAAPATLDMVVTGEGGHAGGVMMVDRHDAFTAACEVVLKLEQLARAASPDTVGTCGLMKLEPAAVNSIPLRATTSFDIRDIDGDRRDRVIADLTAFANEVAQRRGVKIDFHTRNADPPAICAPIVVDAVTQACEATGTKYMKLVSRAYHDSLFMARLAPTGMIFIPCRGGVSHRPDEYSTPEHIALGVDMLARTLATLAS